MSNRSEELKNLISNFIISNSFSSTKDFDEDTFIFREGLLDSMGFMSLIAFIEKNFEMVISDSELVEENFESVNAIVKYLETKKDIS